MKATFLLDLQFSRNDVSSSLLNDEYLIILNNRIYVFKMSYVGIDFGTSHTYVAEYKNNEAIVLGDPICSRGATAYCSTTVGGIKRLLVETEMVSLVLKEAILRIDGNIRNVVIAVPTGFSMCQRKLMCHAATMAGIQSFRIINEPSAAVLAHRILSERVLVVDIGAGKTDISTLLIDNGVCEALGSFSDVSLGGDDFDRLLFDHYPNLSMDECTYLKHKLSTTESISIRDITITRSTFEKIVTPLISRIGNLLNCVISEPNAIILLGGMTTVPCIRKLVLSHFENVKVISEESKTSICQGSAIYAANISRGSGEVDDILLLDVTPMAVGVHTIGNIMMPIIPKNSVIPVTKTHAFTTSRDNQECVDIKIYEGDRAMTTDNYFIGAFSLGRIPPMPRGVAQIELKLTIRINGEVEIVATETSTGHKMSVDLINNFRTVPGHETEYTKERDELVKLLTVTCIGLCDCEHEDSLKDTIFKTKLVALGKDGLVWYDTNPNATAAQIRQKVKSIQNQINPSTE
jgi:molecular chaperone DnaK (HSP70)